MESFFSTGHAETKNLPSYLDGRPHGDPRGNRTPVTAVKGRCLNRLTIGPNDLPLFPLMTRGGIEPPLLP